MQYTFKKVFGVSVSQMELFEHVAKPLVDDLILGKNGKSKGPYPNKKASIMGINVNQPPYTLLLLGWDSLLPLQLLEFSLA